MGENIQQRLRSSACQTEVNQNADGSDEHAVKSKVRLCFPRRPYAEQKGHHKRTGNCRIHSRFFAEESRRWNEDGKNAQLGEKTSHENSYPSDPAHESPPMMSIRTLKYSRRRIPMRVLTTASAILLAGVLASAQAPTPNPTNKTGVIGLMHAIHSTNDAAKTLEFYSAVFGLTGRVGPFQSTGPQILTDSPGATLQVAMTRINGAFNFELTQFGNIERQLNKQPEIADPGAPMLKFIVRDIDAIVAAAKKVNAPIITKGGAPIVVPTSLGKTKAIIMRDPNGYFVEAIQGMPAADSQQGPVIGAILGLTIRDMDETLKYWNGILGLELEAEKNFSNDTAMLDLMGLPKGASYRMAGGLISGSKARIEMIEI